MLAINVICVSHSIPTRINRHHRRRWRAKMEAKEKYCETLPSVHAIADSIMTSQKLYLPVTSLLDPESIKSQLWNGE